ncbi:predicted protein [Lichtheimia corymbifera JMRC:FSU:9682]|uniref:Uncharacterized protein n=1 Tax=Lichtheimia corymbifera JMRC:FSU:9682 TaxID=1263082 RepID=A0A068SDN5_9FUNG|nr:predicted protein [Lichtheimia corymbifera JMRC:FSU:9682]
MDTHQRNSGAIRSTSSLSTWIVLVSTLFQQRQGGYGGNQLLRWMTGATRMDMVLATLKTFFHRASVHVLGQIGLITTASIPFPIIQDIGDMKIDVEAPWSRIGIDLDDVGETFDYNERVISVREENFPVDHMWGTKTIIHEETQMATSSRDKEPNYRTANSDDDDSLYPKQPSFQATQPKQQPFLERLHGIPLASSLQCNAITGSIHADLLLPARYINGTIQQAIL